MKILFPRRTVAIVAAVGAFAAIGVGSASAASTMPASNPIDYGEFHKAALLQVFNVTIKGSQLEGNAFTKTVTNGLIGGMGATISVKKVTSPGYTAYQTITVTPTKVGQVTPVINPAYATLSGGNFGSGTILSTQLAKNSKSFTVKMAFDEQATNPSLNLKFYVFNPPSYLEPPVPGGVSDASTMPASNPIDYGSFNKTATLQVFNTSTQGSQLAGNAFTKTVTNGLMGGMGATISIKKATSNGSLVYQTMTVTPTKVGQVTSSIGPAYVTLSGGNYGAGEILSTQFAKNGKSFTVKMIFSQGTRPNLNLKFYLYHS